MHGLTGGMTVVAPKKTDRLTENERNGLPDMVSLRG